MLRRLLPVLLATTTAVTVASAQQTYAQRGQRIRAGIVILESARPPGGGQPRSAAPHVWFNLDANRTVKPIGWSFVNPYANTRVTTEIGNRWENIAPGTVPAVETRLSKRHAAYWEVNLAQTSDVQLADYDVLLVNPRYASSLNPSEREKLRKFVDHGGLLWIDPAGVTAQDGLNNYPAPFLVNNAADINPAADYSQPLLSQPFALTGRDLNLLNSRLSSVPSLDYVMTPVAGLGAVEGIAGETISDFSRYRPISLVDGLPTTAVARIGEGVVVVTSRGASLKLNRVLASGTNYYFNTGFVGADPVLEADGLSAAKLVVNMVNLLADYRQAGGSSRKTNSSAIDLTAPLLRRSIDPGTTDGASATIYKGLIVSVVGGRVRVYDASPSRDIDGDGDPDDGRPDTAIGSGRDVVWESEVLTDATTPVCTEAPEGGLVDQVLVHHRGGLSIFNLLPRVAGTATLAKALTQAPAATLASPGGAGERLFAPTVHEGYAFVADNIRKGAELAGRVWVANLRTGEVLGGAGQPWSIGGNTGNLTLPPFSAGPTVGYIPILDNSGGLDRVLYLPYQGNGTTVPSSGVASLRLGAKGERPTAFEINGNALQVTTRLLPTNLPILGASGSSLSPRLTVIDADGNPWNAAQMNSIFTGGISSSQGGSIGFTLQAGVTALPANVSVRVDYTVDWAAANSLNISEAIQRGRISLPFSGPGGTSREIIGPVALTPSGTFYVTTRRANSDGLDVNESGLFGFKEEGQGQFRLVSRYELYGRHTYNIGGNSVRQDAVVADNDGLVQQPQFAILRGEFTALEFAGPPSIRNGIVYATVWANKGFIPCTIIMAFRSEPETPSIPLADLPDGSQILQPDFAKSTNKAVPNQQSILVGANYSYSPDERLLRIENLANVRQGQIQSALSMSQPLIIRRPGRTDEVLIPETAAGRWSPLLWYTVINGVRPTTGPVVTGGTLFAGGASGIRRFLAGDGPASFLNPEGTLFAMNSEISSNDPFLKPTLARPWQSQLWQIDNSNGGFAGNPNTKWPQLRGTASQDDYLVRLNQVVLPGSATTNALVGGDGSLVAIGNNGLYTFDRADFVVADEGRVARFDPSGNPMYSLSASANPGGDDSGAVANVRPLVRPTRAYPIGSNDLLIVDPGSNRIVRANQSGVITRSILSFQLDPAFVPPGFRANAPLKLNAPRDVAYYTSYHTSAQLAGLSPSGQAYEYWVHYLIADTGNRRMIELIDRYGFDPGTNRVLDVVNINGRPQTGVLLWHTPANVSGRGYDYVSVNRVFVPNQARDGGRFVFIAGIQNALVTPAGTTGNNQADGLRESGGGNGGIVVFDPSLATGTAVFNRIDIPAIGANVYWNPNAGTNQIAGRPVGAFQSGASEALPKFLPGLQSVTARLTSVNNLPVVSVMIADASGVYEVFYSQTDTGVGSLSNVQWMMPNRVYTAMRRYGASSALLQNTPVPSNPQRLRATYARRLDSGDVLIVNGYTGFTQARPANDTTWANPLPFSGEVVQIDGTIFTAARYNEPNLGFSSRTISFELPPVQETRGLNAPVFADRR